MTRHETGNSKQEHQQKTFNTPQRHRAHTTPPPSLCDFDFSQHGDRRCVSQQMGKQINLLLIFKKVNQLFCSKFKNNVLV